MKERLFVLVIILLLLTAISAYARPIDLDNQAAYPVQATATMIAYPVQATATTTPLPSSTPLPPPIKSRPSNTPPSPPIPDGLPYIPGGDE